MNLKELENLILSLDKKKDFDLINFYLKKRNELVKEINIKLKKAGL